MAEFNFSEFSYFDTNIISEIAKNPSIWKNLYSFLKENNLTLGVGSAQVAELADANKLHKSLVRLFFSVPSAFLINYDEIIKEEIEAHPRIRTKNLLMRPINSMLLEENGFDKLLNFLKSDNLKIERKNQLQNAKSMHSRFIELKNNYKPLKLGKYAKEQANEFADFQVIQWLNKIDRNFLLSFQTNISELHLEIFLSIRMYAYVLFYKYYLGNREPKRMSDFGDLFHLFHIPYCKLIVTERDLCNILNQIKKNESILENSEILNIDFLKKLNY